MTTSDVENRYYKPVIEAHLVVDVIKPILEDNPAGTCLGLCVKRESGKCECTEPKLRIGSDYCRRRFALLYAVLSISVWIPSRGVQGCRTCFVVPETSTECGLFVDNMELQTHPLRPVTGQ